LKLITLLLFYKRLKVLKSYLESKKLGLDIGKSITLVFGKDEREIISFDLKGELREDNWVSCELWWGENG